MKTFFKISIAVAALTLISGFNSANAQKFGFMDLYALMESMPEMTDVRTKYEAFEKDLYDTMESMTVEYANKWEEFNKASAELSDAVRQVKIDELEKLRERIQEFDQMMGENAKNEYQKLVSPLLEKAQEAIQKVAKTNGLTAVFEVNSGAMSYHDENQMTNVLPLVQKELGITPAN